LKDFSWELRVPITFGRNRDDPLACEACGHVYQCVLFLGSSKAEHGWFLVIVPASKVAWVSVPGPGHRRKRRLPEGSGTEKPSPLATRLASALPLGSLELITHGSGSEDVADDQPDEQDA